MNSETPKYEPPAGRVLGTIAGLTRFKGGVSPDALAGGIPNAPS
jgi:hypothetical protein